MTDEDELNRVRRDARLLRDSWPDIRISLSQEQAGCLLLAGTLRRKYPDGTRILSDLHGQDIHNIHVIGDTE